MKSGKVEPPAITPHRTIYFRVIARITGKVVLWSLIIFNRASKKPQLPRVRAVITYGDKVLLIKNVTHFNRWTLPGGGVKKGESFDWSLAREIREELTLDYDYKDYVFVNKYNQNDTKLPFEKICYWLDLTNKSDYQTISLSHEILDAKWFPIDKIPDNTSSITKKMLRDTLRAIG